MMCFVRESERPLAERVSFLDRPATERDRLAIESRPFLKRRASRLACFRVAVQAEDATVLIGKDDSDSLFVTCFDTHGGGGSGTGRWVLREHGAIMSVASNTDRALLYGVVSDEVIAVRVGGRWAHFENNAFLAEIDRDTVPDIVITTKDGDRPITYPPF